MLKCRSVRGVHCLYKDHLKVYIDTSFVDPLGLFTFHMYLYLLGVFNVHM